MGPFSLGIFLLNFELISHSVCKMYIVSFRLSIRLIRSVLVSDDDSDNGDGKEFSNNLN